MNKTVTSKEEILEVSRTIAAREGITAVNMRTVAAGCGIALGSLYNYFPGFANTFPAHFYSLLYNKKLLAASFAAVLYVISPIASAATISTFPTFSPFR